MQQRIEYTATRVVLTTDRPFDAVCDALERAAGRGDLDHLATLGSREEILATIPTTLGPSGFSIFGVVEHGLLVTELGKGALRARLYLVGNPLIAADMTSVTPAAGLYAPLRLLVVAGDGATTISYDQPSSQIAPLGSPAVTETARMLDDRLGALAREIAGL